MVKTSESYQKCEESKKSTEQRTDSQTAPNARNTLKKYILAETELQDINGEKKSQEREEKTRRESQTLRETFNKRSGSTLSKIISKPNTKKLPYISKHEDDCWIFSQQF